MSVDIPEEVELDSESEIDVWRDLEWVYRNLGSRSSKNAPSSAARSLLDSAKKNPSDFVQKFVKYQQEREARKLVSDGDLAEDRKSTLRQIEKLQKAVEPDIDDLLREIHEKFPEQWALTVNAICGDKNGESSSTPPTPQPPEIVESPLQQAGIDVLDPERFQKARLEELERRRIRREEKLKEEQDRDERKRQRLEREAQVLREKRELAKAKWLERQQRREEERRMNREYAAQRKRELSERPTEEPSAESHCAAEGQ